MNTEQIADTAASGGSALNVQLEVELAHRCGNDQCFVHEGETCHQGEMQHENCALYKQAVNAKSNRLDACPFCGKAHTLKLKTAQAIAEEDYDYGGELWDHSESWAVLCDASKPKGPGGCGASGGFFSTEYEAVQAWNTRA